MRGQAKPTHTQPGGFIEPSKDADNGIVNDSLGTIEDADSTGLDESNTAGNTERQDCNTRQD